MRLAASYGGIGGAGLQQLGFSTGVTCSSGSPGSSVGESQADMWEIWREMKRI
jgi:hypothetical protein